MRVIGELVESAITRWTLPVQFDRSEIEIVDGYVGAGYAKSQRAELETLRDVARSEGIVLDPVYTGKAFHGLMTGAPADRNAFGSRIVFVHTDGVFGVFPKGSDIAALL